MKYVNLGRSGLQVSRLCLGCMSYGDPERLPQPWSLDEKASRPLIRQALEAGINFFDTANIYSGGSSEEITGKALREMARRDEIVVDCRDFAQQPGPENDEPWQLTAQSQCPSLRNCCYRYKALFPAEQGAPWPARPLPMVYNDRCDASDRRQYGRS